MKTELKKAILKQIGVTEKEFKANISDYYDASCGISGFIYYDETHNFAMKNRELINELITDFSDDLGMDPYELITSFNILKDNLDKEDKKEIHGYLSGFDCEIYPGQVTNAIAWFCVENLAFQLSE